MAEVEDKDKTIAEKEKLYVELKTIIQRQPGPEVGEQLKVYQESLAKKGTQLQAMKETLGQFHNQYTESTVKYQELQEELKEINERYVADRLRHDAEKARQERLNALMGRGAHEPAEPEVYTGYFAPPRPTTSDPAQSSSAHLNAILDIEGVNETAEHAVPENPSGESEGTQVVEAQ